MDLCRGCRRSESLGFQSQWIFSDSNTFSCCPRASFSDVRQIGWFLLICHRTAVPKMLLENHLRTTGSTAQLNWSANQGLQVACRSGWRNALDPAGVPPTLAFWPELKIFLQFSLWQSVMRVGWFLQEEKVHFLMCYIPWAGKKQMLVLFATFFLLCVCLVEIGERWGVRGEGWSLTFC